MVKGFWQDLRHAGRMFVKNPGFASLVIVSIAIGVGANTAMFSLADGLLLRPLPVPDASGVISVVGAPPTSGFGRPQGLSYADYQDVRARARSFDSLVAYRQIVTSFAAHPAEPAERTLGVLSTSNLFSAMGIQPALGRLLFPDDDVAPGRNPVVVLDHRTWTRSFGGDPNVLGRVVRIGSGQFTVVGVTPSSFTGIEQDTWPTFYVPITMVGTILNSPPTELTRRDARGMRVKGRLRDGVSIAQARQEMATIADDLRRTYPETNRAQRLTVRTEWELRSAGADSVFVAMLLALAFGVLLVACTNVAGVLTSRTLTRSREITMRLAIGASRWRLVRQLLTESAVLALFGGALGILLGYGGILLLRQIEFPTEVPLKLTFDLDRRVLAIAAVAAAASALLSSLVPAWRASRTDLVTTIKSTAGVSEMSRQWGRRGLVCFQVAVALVILSVATASYEGFRRRLAQGPGYRTAGLLMLRVDPQLAGYDNARGQMFFDQLKERAAQLPQVTSVALMTAVPMKTDTTEAFRIAPEGARLPDDADSIGVRASRVDERFFETLGIRITRGRSFTSRDNASAPGVVIVNETMAQRYWPSQSPIGKRITMFAPGGGRVGREIVGVAADSKQDFILEDPLPFIYVPHRQMPASDTTVVVATRNDPTALAAAMRGIIKDLDSGVTVYGVRTMADLYHARAVTIANVIVQIVGAMGAMGLALALVGMYGLVAYAVSRRTREIGVRMAVGALPSMVLRMVLRSSTTLTIIGLAIGLIGSWGTRQALRAGMAGLGETPFIVWLGVMPLVFAITLIAAYIPARRAARIDPLVALRAE